jgi:hypothetical protein
MSTRNEFDAAIDASREKVRALIDLLKDDLRWGDIESATEDQQRELRQILGFWLTQMQEGL